MQIDPFTYERLSSNFISMRGDTTTSPSTYRRAILLPTLETSLSFTAERETLSKPHSLARRGLEICMQISRNDVAAKN